MNTIGGKGQPWWNPMSSENESNVMQAKISLQQRSLIPHIQKKSVWVTINEWAGGIVI